MEIIVLTTCTHFQQSTERKDAWIKILESIKTRVTTECEREHQEHLLLSVMPAYIAAEVKG